MAEILGAVTSGTKFFLEVGGVSIDNLTFKLYYKATTTILLALSIVCTSKQFFGDPISCDVRGGGVNDKVLNTYCWMYATFNINEKFKGQCFKKEVDGSNLYNTYYQWVAIYLVVQAVVFYLPRLIWLSCEGGLLKFLAKGTRGKIVEGAQEKIENLLATFQEHLHNKYNRYAFIFFLCEILNLIVVISQIFVTNKFLNYTFLDYGIKVWFYFGVPLEERELLVLNPMCEAFPRIASCTYHRYGGAGEEETKNALCVLGLNMINDKVFLIIWVWYFFIMFNSGFRLIYRIFQILFPRLRFWMLRRKIHRYFKSDPNTRHIEHYIINASIGDWFVLYQMAKSMNKRFFAQFLTILSKRVNPHPNEECDEAPFFHNCSMPGSKGEKVSQMGLMNQMKIEVGNGPTKEANGGASSPSAPEAETPDCSCPPESKTPKPKSEDCTENSVGHNLDLTFMGEDKEEEDDKKGSKEKIIPGKGDVVGPWS